MRSRTKRTWRRVGWGALIGLGVLIAIVAVALWLGPPRDPKCFALDDEDFGLGFKVGDPWDPDAFEKAMIAGGLHVERLPDIDPSYMPDLEIEEFPFYSESWTTADGCLMILLISDNKLPTAELRNVNLNSDLPSEEWGRERTREVYRESREKFPDDQQKRLDFMSEMGAVETARRYARVSTSEGIGFADSLDEVKNTYGKPFMELPFSPGSPILMYFGDRQSVTFFYSNERIAAMSILRGYREAGLIGRAGLWFEYLSFPFVLRWIEREQREYETERADEEANGELAEGVR